MKANNKRKMFAILLSLLILPLAPLTALATAPADPLDPEAPEDPPAPTVEDITAQSAIVIDFETGLELYSRNADDRRSPASMTKTMVVYLVYEAIANGEIALDTPVPISEGAFELASDTEYTNVRLLEGETYTVDEMLDAVIIVSACGATVALAEFLGDSTDGFLEMMNAKAEQWGIDAVFYNVYGGTDEPQETLVSARAMATIVRNTIQDFPEILAKTSRKTLQFGEKEYRNTNTLLGQYEDLDGFKTGYTRAAGACLAATAERESIRIITVVMGAEGNAGRFGDTAILLDYGFENVQEIRELAAPSPTPEPTIEPTPDPTPAPTPRNTPPVQGGILDEAPNPDGEDEETQDEEIQDEKPPSGGFWFFVFIFAVIASLVFITFMASQIRR